MLVSLTEKHYTVRIIVVRRVDVVFKKRSVKERAASRSELLVFHSWPAATVFPHSGKRKTNKTHEFKAATQVHALANAKSFFRQNRPKKAHYVWRKIAMHLVCQKRAKLEQ